MVNKLTIINKGMVEYNINFKKFCENVEMIQELQLTQEQREFQPKWRLWLDIGTELEISNQVNVYRQPDLQFPFSAHIDLPTCPHTASQRFILWEFGTRYRGEAQSWHQGIRWKLECRLIRISSLLSPCIVPKTASRYIFHEAKNESILL